MSENFGELLVFQKPITSVASGSPDSPDRLTSALTRLSDTCVLYLLFFSAPPLSSLCPFPSPWSLCLICQCLSLAAFDRRMRLAHLFFMSILVFCFTFVITCSPLFSFHNENEMSIILFSKV